jgi:CheY-like chemotaxis protein
VTGARPRRSLQLGSVATLVALLLLARLTTARVQGSVRADVTPWHRERLLEAGAAEYLTKPLDVPRFLSVIDGILVAARP